MYRSGTGIVLAALFALAGAAPAASQEDVLRGRVLLQGQPATAVPVTLHRVTAGESGVVATAVSDAAGRFQIPLPAADSGGFTVYFTTAEYASVRYFGPPIHPDEPAPSYAVEVFDTAAATPGALRLARRDLVAFPHADGGWEVNEVVRLRNTADRTIVARGGMPTAEIRLPQGAAGFEMGEAELPSDQVRQMGDRVLLLMPLVPGDRELYFRYRLPADADQTVLSLDTPADTVNLFVQQPGPRVEVTGLRASERFEVQGQQFLRFTGADLATGSEVRLQWETDRAPVSPVLAGVSAAAILLLAGAGAAVRDRGRGGAAAGP